MTTPPQSRRAVFLDRDGTLIEEKHYLRDPALVAFFPGAISAMKRLQDAGYFLVMVTNQSGVGRGYFTLEDVAKVHHRLEADLALGGVKLDRIYIAPEAPDAPSRGRKPSPAFLFDARDEFGIDLANSFMIGDKLIDLECGWNAGVRQSILVRTSYGAGVEKALGDDRKRTVVVNDFAEAADWILKR